MKFVRVVLVFIVMLEEEGLKEEEAVRKESSKQLVQRSSE
jgi:hypothetical protein